MTAMQVQVQSNFSYVQFDSAAVARLLRGPDGPVFRHMVKQGDLVKDEAKRLVGVSRPIRMTGPYHRPGTLKDRIVKRVVQAPGGDVAVQVGADVPYALYHHEGWPGGVIIRPKKPGGVLAFYWSKGNQVIKGNQAAPLTYRRWVRQGSFRGNKFLVDALRVLNR